MPNKANTTVPGAPAGLNKPNRSPETQGNTRVDEGSEQCTFERVQSRAYKLWEEAGKPDGDVAREQCWRQAECELLAESTKT